MSDLTTVSYSTLPFYSMFDRDKIAVANGKLYFYDQNTRAPKPVYSTPGGASAYPSPLELDSAGRVPPLYFEVDKPYYIELRDSSGVLIWSFSNFTPPAGGSGPVSLTSDFDNLVINGQFRFFEQGQYLSVPTTRSLIADPAFYFQKDGTGATDQIDFVRFQLDANETAQTSPDSTPVYYFKYTCSVPSATESFKDLVYVIKDVRSLQQEQCTLQIGAATLDGSTKQLELRYEQYFGSGSPSATNSQTIGTMAINANWEDKFLTFSFDSLAGKSIGPNDDDELRIIVRLPLNQTCEVGLTNIYLKRGASTDDYPYQTYNETRAKIRALDIPEGTKADNYDSVTYVTSNSQDPNDPNYNGSGFYSLMPNPPVGSMLDWPKLSDAPDGYLICDGAAYVKQGLYNRLFNVLDYSFTNRYGFSNQSISSTEIRLHADDIGVVSTTSSSNTGGVAITVATAGSATDRQELSLTFKAASDIGQLSYLKLYTPKGKFLVWFNKESTYVDPTSLPSENSHKYIEIKLDSGDSAATVTTKFTDQFFNSGGASIENFTATSTTDVVKVVNQKIGTVKSSPSAGTTSFTLSVTQEGTATAYEETSITCTSAAAANLKPGDYFQVSTNGKDIVFWFLIDGIGTKPSVSGDLFAPIIVNSTDTSTEVATAVKTAMDYLMYQVIDLRRMFVRYYSDASSNDTLHYYPQQSKRHGRPDGNSGGNIGTIEYEDIISHTHPNNEESAPAGGGGGGITMWAYKNGANEPFVTYAGGTQNIPMNILLTKIIKY